MIVELLFLLVALAICWSFLEKRVHKFPPGPIGLPLLGHLPMLGTKPHETLLKWKKTYGDVIGVWFGSYRTVVINDAKLVREAMSMNVFTGRPCMNFFQARCEDKIVRGLVFTDGSQWMEQRRFALKNLRDFGLGTKTMEANVQEEIDEFLKRIAQTEGKPLQVKGLFDSAVVGALWRILFGEILDSDDPDASAAFGGITSIFDDSSLLGSLPMFLPWLARLAPKLSGYEKMVGGYPSIKYFLQKRLDSHNKHYVQNQPRDFVDAYMDEINVTTDSKSSFYAKNGVLLHTMLDLFAAGGETTSTTLAWLCAYLIHHKEVQKKLQNEIDEVIGKERIPTVADRPNMPYTEAVLNEVFRIASVFPFSVIHSATEDTEFHGFVIPKDTVVIPNLYAVHFDENIWGDPQNFRPERFIDSNGKFKKNENLIPFSVGKRVCIGEGLARNELFLFTTNLFQVYCVSEDGGLPSLEPHMGFTLSPQPFKMVLKKRVE